MNNSCQSFLEDLQNQLNQYEQLGGEDDLQVPQHFKDKAAAMLAQFRDFSSRGERRSDAIVHVVKSWEEFVASVDVLTEWMRSEVNPELTELKEVENFAMEFSSHQTRLEVSIPSSNL